MFKRILMIGAIGLAIAACTPSDGASGSPTFDPLESMPAESMPVESMEPTDEMVDPSASPS